MRIDYQASAIGFVKEITMAGNNRPDANRRRQRDAIGPETTSRTRPGSPSMNLIAGRNV
jgi:hypothetical protein